MVARCGWREEPRQYHRSPDRPVSGIRPFGRRSDAVRLHRDEGLPEASPLAAATTSVRAISSRLGGLSPGEVRRRWVIEKTTSERRKRTATKMTPATIIG
jgi:hypothetical protein